MSAEKGRKVIIAAQSYLQLDLPRILSITAMLRNWWLGLHGWLQEPLYCRWSNYYCSSGPVVWFLVSFPQVPFALNFFYQRKIPRVVLWSQYSLSCLRHTSAIVSFCHARILCQGILFWWHPCELMLRFFSSLCSLWGLFTSNFFSTMNAFSNR